MIQLKNITKSYTTGNFTQTALDKISLNFRENEFVAILGQSGSGKTTLLNVLGGLDKYDTGDLIINGRSTKKFKVSHWDAYRNNSVGFIFQSYNLIPHLNIMDNVEMGMTLSGVSSSKKKAKAIEVLEKVGLKEHLHKKPNQLSGGQMQRVAIARALANDPDIILADEPTGALDTQTSEQIMDLIREISKDKLVVMVTHNPDIATKYADRIVKFSDGKITDDSNPLSDENEDDKYVPKKTSMGFFTALKLSGKNILTKKGRTALTAFACSIGIIGVALILALSNGFDKQINNFEKGSLSNFPVTISESSISVESAMGRQNAEDKEKYPSDSVVYPYNPSENTIIHDNIITPEYVDYVNQLDSMLYDGISFTRSVNMNILKMCEGKASSVDLSAAGFTSYPTKTDGDYSDYFDAYYDILSGTTPTNSTDLILIVDQYNQLNVSTMDALGLDYTKESIDFDKLIGTEYKLIFNNDYYIKSGEYYTVNGTAGDLSGLYNSNNAITLKICGIARIKEDATISALPSGIAYSDELALNYIENANQSDIVKAQESTDYNILTGSAFTVEDIASSNPYMMGAMTGSTSPQTKSEMLAWLGKDSVPTSIYIFPIDFDTKEQITAYLDTWNEGLSETDRIEYTDMAATITSLSATIMDGITIVLIAFAAISLVVSMIMVAIIIYISVLERTKEIGVLRALGARGKDISRVFNAETFIIGACSGIMGIIISYILIIPANAILYNITELKHVAQLNPLHALMLIIISIILTMLGGFIPAKMSAKKDPVEALRTE